MGESGSEVYYFVPKPRNFVEVIRFSEDIKKPWLKATLKENKKLINNQNFLFQEREKGKPATPCMYVYKAKLQSDRILDKLKLRILVKGDLQNKEVVGDTW